MIKPSKSFLLLVGDDGALLLPPRNVEPIFAHSHLMLDAKPIMQAISSAPKTPILIINDCSLQKYTLEDIPKLSTHDRQKYLKRRINDFHPTLTYKGFLYYDNSKALLLGAENTKAIQTWQNRIQELTGTTAITCLLPVECADLVLKLEPKTNKGWALLLSVHQTGGIRQIVTCDGKIVFTRLTPPIKNKSSAGYISANIGVEIKATRDYLARIGLSKEKELRLISIAPKGMHKAISQAALDVSSRTLFTPPEAARKLKLRYKYKDENEIICDTVFLKWLARKKKLTAPLLTPEKQEEVYNQLIYKIGMIITLITAMLAGGLIGFSALRYLKDQRTVYAIQYDINQMHKTIAKKKDKLTTATEPLPKLRMAVERKRLFHKDELEINKLINTVMISLTPQAKLSDLSYKNGELHFTVHINDEDQADLIHVLEQNIRNNINDKDISYTVTTSTSNIGELSNLHINNNAQNKDKLHARFSIMRSKS